MIKYDKDDNTSIVDIAIRNGLATKEEIRLFEQLSIALELIDEDFNIIYSNINDGIHFGITTPYPNALPESIGILFFNIDLSFNVNITEILDIHDDESIHQFNIDSSEFNIKPIERYFLVKITKT
jgi:hypothetical protein